MAGSRPVKTHGLTHVALAVRDPQRSLRFDQKILGMVPVYQNDSFVQAQTPGTRDVPGEPYVFFTDPDGYEVEIWYEIPTPIDP